MSFRNEGVHSVPLYSCQTLVFCISTRLVYIRKLLFHIIKGADFREVFLVRQR